MPIDNSLNVSELFRRLGAKGDSLGSAPLLESLRLNLQIGDLSDLVPPVGVPLGGAAIFSTSAVATMNKWTLQCRSPGGLTVRKLASETTAALDVWISAANPFGGIVLSAVHNFSFRQPALSLFSSHTPAAKVAPANTFRIQGPQQPSIASDFDNWVGPGEFLNIEAEGANNTQVIAITWKEYPAALNP